MKMSFVVSVKTVETDATAWHKALPRTKRKALRVITPTCKPQAYTSLDVDTYLHTEYRVDTYHTQNLEFLDRGYDFDEFQDIDDEHEGLTITEPMSEVELFQFCTGYDII